MNPGVETFFTATRVCVPTEKSDVLALIEKINDHISVQPVQLAFLDYAEFVDEAEDDEDSDGFMPDLFAETVADHWTFVNVLHRNGENTQVREFHAFLDQYITGVDTVDEIMNFDF